MLGGDNPIYDELMRHHAPSSPALYDAIAQRMANVYLVDGLLAAVIDRWAIEAAAADVRHIWDEMEDES